MCDDFADFTRITRTLFYRCSRHEIINSFYYVLYVTRRLSDMCTLLKVLVLLHCLGLYVLLCDGPVHVMTVETVIIYHFFFTANPRLLTFLTSRVRGYLKAHDPKTSLSFFLNSRTSLAHISDGGRG